MLALYRSGQQVEALRAYQALRLRMDEELGVAPFTEIQALHRRILQGRRDADFSGLRNRCLTPWADRPPTTTAGSIRPKCSGPG